MAASDLIVGAHFNQIGEGPWLDYVQDGSSPKPSATTDSPVVVSGGEFGGALDLDGVDRSAVWTGSHVEALQQTGCISFWVYPEWSEIGGPTEDQTLFFSTQSGGLIDAISIVYKTTQALEVTIYSSAGAAIVSYSESWFPATLEWDHIEVNFDVTTGATRVFINGTQLGLTDTATGTRTATSDWMAVGLTEGTVTDSEFQIDELLAFDAVQHTTGFTSPTSEESFDIPSDDVKVGMREAA